MPFYLQRESDSDMDCLKKPAFVVSKIKENINFSLPPTSGEEYIQRVIIEAQQCPDVVVANIDKTRLKKPTVEVEPLSGCIEAPSCLGPTLDWQTHQISEFSHMRLYITQLKSEIQTFKRKWSSPKIEMPNFDDEDSWIKLCTGEGNTTLSPTLNIMFSFSQSLVEQILEYLVDHTGKEKRIGYHLGQWMYALLVILELPMNPDTCACLRTFARTCALIRADPRELEECELRALNLFICLVARYFRQLDLADP